jgi:hypothetical protein
MNPLDSAAYIPTFKSYLLLPLSGCSNIPPPPQIAQMLTFYSLDDEILSSPAQIVDMIWMRKLGELKWWDV